MILPLLRSFDLHSVTASRFEFHFIPNKILINAQDWIGQPFGTKIKSRPPGQGCVYILEPTPELWTTILRHRTQILYVADISMVCMALELRPGVTGWEHRITPLE